MFGSYWLVNIVVLFIRCVTMNSIQDTKWIQNRALSGHLPMAGSLGYRKTRSLIECTKDCSREAGVESLFYVRISGLCHCHTSSYSDTSTFLEEMTAVYFMKPNDNPCNATNKYIRISTPISMTFRIYTTEVDHDIAEANCNSDGANLIVIKTVTKQQYLQDLLQTCTEFPGHDYWIDGSNLHASNCTVDEGWIFSDGNQIDMTKEVFWATIAPNHGCVERCLRMREEVDYLWDNQRCSNPYGYICEK